jgi:hypothetical protein
MNLEHIMKIVYILAKESNQIKFKELIVFYEN